MNGISLTLRLLLLTGFSSIISTVNGQGMGGSGMNAPINQVEAIESHLQQSRTQSSREIDESAKKKPKAYEFAKPAANSQPLKPKKPDGESEKSKAAATSGINNE